jgi:hypothetical protein
MFFDELLLKRHFPVNTPTKRARESIAAKRAIPNFFGASINFTLAVAGPPSINQLPMTQWNYLPITPLDESGPRCDVQIAAHT